MEWYCNLFRLTGFGKKKSKVVSESTLCFQKKTASQTKLRFYLFHRNCLFETTKALLSSWEPFNSASSARHTGTPAILQQLPPAANRLRHFAKKMVPFIFQYFDLRRIPRCAITLSVWNNLGILGDRTSAWAKNAPVYTIKLHLFHVWHLGTRLSGSLLLWRKWGALAWFDICGCGDSAPEYLQQRARDAQKVVNTIKQDKPWYRSVKNSAIRSNWTPP
jgi:hypothetical protein